MKLLVFGASGRTGRCVLHQAIDTGDDVTAFERTERPLEAHRLFVGDVLDPDAVQVALAGQDAVISVLGPRADGPSDICSRAMRNIVPRMKSMGCTRLVCVTGAMVGHPHDHLGVAFKVIEKASAAAQEAVRDGRVEEDIIRSSGLDWTLVRPPRLTDGPLTKRYHWGEDIALGSLAHVSRADLAHLLLELVREPHWTQKAVAIAGP